MNYRIVIVMSHMGAPLLQQREWLLGYFGHLPIFYIDVVGKERSAWYPAKVCIMYNFMFILFYDFGVLQYFTICILGITPLKICDYKIL